MLLPLLLNNVLSSGASLAFVGPNIDDLTLPVDVLMAQQDYTDRFVGESSYQLIGTLPAGLSFSNGILSGTPTETGVFGPFKIRAT